MVFPLPSFQRVALQSLRHTNLHNSQMEIKPAQAQGHWQSSTGQTAALVQGLNLHSQAVLSQGQAIEQQATTITEKLSSLADARKNHITELTEKHQVIQAQMAGATGSVEFYMQKSLFSVSQSLLSISNNKAFSMAHLWAGQAGELDELKEVLGL